MIPLVDVHCHLLAGLDDGPRTPADALAMCRIAYEDGIQMTAATAHQSARWADNDPNRIRTATRELSAALLAAGVPLTVVPCAEVMAEPETPIAWEAGRLLSLGDRGQYLLLEMPHGQFVDLALTLARLRRAGLRAVLAHPERCPELLEDAGRIEGLIEAGCLVQVSSGSVAEPRGPRDEKALRDWFRRGVVHLMGTDGHSARRRPPRMADAYRQVVRWAGRAVADRVCSANGLAVLQGLPLRGAAAAEGSPLVPLLVVNGQRMSAVMSVCHLGKFYPPAAGGMETHVRTFARAQARLGAEVSVLCVNHQDRDGHDATWRRFAATATVEQADGPVRVTRLGRRASLARLDLCPRLPLLLSHMARRPGHLLHLHLPNATMLLALAACRPRLPVVVTYHSDVVRQKRLVLLLRPFERLMLGRAAAILSDSPTYPAGSPLLRHYPEKLDVLPLGIDLAPYLEPGPRALAFARELRDRHGQPLWLAVGRLVYYKGLHNALRALPLVPGRLLIVGDGPLRADLQRLAEELGVAGRVVWCGRLDDEELVGAYHAATALWFPSNARSEAFGLVQVEAMACACPVLNAAIPDSGVAWVSPHEVSGLTVAVDDPAGLAAAANRLLTEPGLRERLSRQARARAQEEFADDLMARRSLAIYRGVLGEKRAAPPAALVEGPE